MAAPDSKSIADLNGKWVMNKTLSSSTDPALALQGVGWVTRKVVGLATITLHVKQFAAEPSPVGPNADQPAPTSDPVTHVDIEQTGTGGMKGTTERRCLDDALREHTDYLFGHVRGRTRWVDLAEVEDEFLKAGWNEEGETAGGQDGKLHMLSWVESLDRGWVATQVWGFKKVDGERMYARNIVITKGKERVELNLYYDYVA
ncbi:uncharacterized protein E0L32_009619 [Thyridium curvatum]|uniref:Uncharacterized protein n=1 Tax=Thyridium curvatum TaxID=1093900 RepID=A0A507AGL5_9PEZI|nr:uncharacterized protein E0L32_009619 [Thyridium curvatum]TPX08915.1 hypothetical protein E0L32_009619 [Thyridium curvatum]